MSRWDDVRRWRDRLRAFDAGSEPGVLSPEGARLAFTAALDALSDPALDVAAGIPGAPYGEAVVVTARTVPGAPIEWVAALLGRGARVVVKHPAGDPGWTGALVDAARAVGLPLSATSARGEVSTADLVVAMGSDDTAAAVRASARPEAKVLAFGHRFSVAFVRGSDIAEDPVVPDGFRDAWGALAADVATYDGRGCFSPVAVFTDADPDVATEALADALRRAHARWPRGHTSPIEGATTRARGALARVTGREITGDGWAVHQLPVEFFEPTTLPRAVALHPVPDVDAAIAAVRPWARWLSSVATDVPGSGDAWRAIGASRVCSPGRLQRPPLDRLHDGVDWLHEVVRDD